MRSGWLRASIYWVLLVLGSALLFQNHYPRFTGAPSCRFRTLTRRPPSVDSGLAEAQRDLVERLEAMRTRSEKRRWWWEVIVVGSVLVLVTLAAPTLAVWVENRFLGGG